MRESDLVRTVTIKHVSEGASQVIADNKAIAASQDQLASSSESLASVTETSAKRQASQLTQFERMERAQNQAAKALNDFAKASSVAQNVLGNPAVSDDRVVNFLQRYVEKLDAATAAQNRFVQSRIPSSAMNIDQRMGIGAPLTNTAAASASVFQAEFDKQAAAAATLKQRIDPLGTAFTTLSKDVAEYNAMQKAGLLTQDQVAKATALSVKRFEDVEHSLKSAGTAGRVMSGELVNMSYQLNDVVTGLALGQSPFMIIGQQGGQVVQILQNSKASIREFGSAAASSIASVLTPMRLLVGGAAGVATAAVYFGYKWQEASAEVDRALAGVGRRTGTTAADIANFTKTNATATGLSVSEARNVALEFTKTGEVTISQLQGVGQAIHGYALLTGKDATEATKDFAIALEGDVLKNIIALDKGYGSLNATSLEYIRSLIDQGDKTKALQAFIDSTSSANKRAEVSVGSLSKAWQGFKNIISNIAAGPAPTSIEDQIADVQKQIERAKSTPSAGITPGGFLNTSAAFGGKSAELDELNKKLAELQQRLSDADASKLTAQLDDVSKKAFEATNAILPQINAIRDLDKAIREIEQAKAGGNAPSNADAALAVYQQQRELQQQSLDATVRQAQAAAALQNTYGDVTQQTAQTLNNLNLQLNVAQQLTAAGQMRAQADATYAQLRGQRVQEQEAALIATKQEELARANATTQILKQVEALKDQNELIKAQQNGTEATTAAAIAYKNALNASGDEVAAAALKTQTMANYMQQTAGAAQTLAQFVASAANAMNRFVAGQGQSLAYAMQMANAASASSGSSGAQTLGNASYFNGNLTGVNGTGGIYDSGGNLVGIQSASTRGSQSTSTIDPLGLRDPAVAQSFGFSIDVNKVVGDAYRTGGASAAIAALTKVGNTTGVNNDIAALYARSSGYDLQTLFGQETSTVPQKISAYDNLFQLMNSGTTDNNVKIANLQQELGLIQGLPGGVERDQKIADLQNAIVDLTQSTDALNQTNGDLLSPYYNQDPRTSHIGFRSQGMASTGYIDIPGTPSANDNMTLTLPVASGERVGVWNGPNRGGSSQTINVTNHIIIQGNANKDEIGRTMYQIGQTQAKQIQAASR